MVRHVHLYHKPFPSDPRFIQCDCGAATRADRASENPCVSYRGVWPCGQDLQNLRPPALLPAEPEVVQVYAAHRPDAWGQDGPAGEVGGVRALHPARGRGNGRLR